MTGLRGLVRSEAILLRRNPAVVLWVAILPLVAAIVLGAIPATRDPVKDLGGLSWFSTYQPILLFFAVALLAIQALPDVLTRYREQGVLKRLRATPASPSALLSAQFILTAGVSLVVGLLIVVVPALLGAGWPGNPIGLLVAFAVMMLCLLSIGMVVASVFTRNKVAAAAGTVLFFVLAFLGGLWWPRQTMPGWMQTISDLSPAGAAVGGLQDALAGGWPGWSHLLVMLVWTGGLSLLSVRLFRWE